MTAVVPAPAGARAAGTVLLGSFGRMLRLEIKRSAMVWMLPLLAALFVFDPYRTATGYPPVWTIHTSVVLNKLLPDFIIFTSGFSAWAGSREGRRHAGDLLGTTARPAWMRHIAALCGAVFWALGGFLVAVVVLYVRTASVATWGGPPLWPVAVGTVAMITVCAVGYTAGALFPGRFTAPIVAVGITVLDLYGFRRAVAEQNYGFWQAAASNGTQLLSPTRDVPAPDAGVFYHVAPDISIVQVMFMGGLTLAALGVLGLSPRTGGVGFRGVLDFASGAGPRVRTVATAVLVAGVAAAVTAVALTETAKPAISGWDIPALHSAASDRPVPYTPDCSGGTGRGISACVHPAFGGYLADVSGALAPVLREVRGLPGAPVRATQIPGNTLPSSVLYGNGSGVITGSPSVYEFTLNNTVGLAGTVPGQFQQLRQDLLQRLVSGPPSGDGAVSGSGAGADTQQAVVIALLAAVGSRPASQQGPASPQGSASPQQETINAAAKRFERLSASARHAWLASNLPALRAGRVTLAQLP
ncbi:MAG TPA: hypothetical protein VF060_29940 [Trebonia sp.]